MAYSASCGWLDCTAQQLLDVLPQISIAHACKVAFTGLLCLFSVIGLLPVCLLRFTMGPGVGIFSKLRLA